jgi:dTDP-4-amino-4,6-dideoxygalactose transaminase
MIPYSKQKILAEDIQAVTKILKSDYLTQGPTVINFESRIADYVNSKYSIAVNSATSGLHIACLALGLSDGDIVWTSPISFVASSNCALYCGANIDFVDIDRETLNMSIPALEKKLIDAKQSKKLPKIIIPVHMAGQSCDMKELFKLSKKYGFKIIEDASHAIGGEYRNKKIGSCFYSHACVFSFHPVKIITTFEGGIVTTNDHKLAVKMAALRSHGIVNQNFKNKKNEGLWYYEQQSLGFNYRMSEIEAALGISLLKLEMT